MGSTLDAEAPEGLHFFHDINALIQLEPGGEHLDLPPRALSIASVRSTALFTLLNVSTGDSGGGRRAGVRLGWTTHLQTIRSYEKLTAGGMTFLDTDVIRVLEEALPGRFGGGPTDYQLVEDETADGHPLWLLVHPAVGPLNTHAVAEAFLTSISAGSGVEKVMGLLWRDAGLLHVERRMPLATASGKVLHLHVAPRTADAGARRFRHAEVGND